MVELHAMQQVPVADLKDLAMVRRGDCFRPDDSVNRNATDRPLKEPGSIVGSVVNTGVEVEEVKRYGKPVAVARGPVVELVHVPNFPRLDVPNVTSGVRAMVLAPVLIVTCLGYAERGAATLVHRVVNTSPLKLEDVF